MSAKNYNFIYYLHIWYQRHLWGFCPECNSSAPKMYNCPICHNDRTSPFNKKKRKRYWLRWRVMHGYTNVHYTFEEKMFIMEQELDIPYHLRFYKINHENKKTDNDY